MKFNELWIRELVNLNINRKQLIEKMIMLGLEVENLEEINFNSSYIIIGRIVKCKQFLKNKKLWLLKIDINKENLLTIISSFKNCKKNLIVPIALPGAMLTNNKKINVKLINNYISEGKLCSFYDLGMLHYSNEVIELYNKKMLLGNRIDNYIKTNDCIFNINIPNNRSDYLSILGISRDIAAVNNIKLNFPKIKKVKPQFILNIPINIYNFNYYFCYAIRAIKYINILSKTPIWIIEKLLKCGINISDVITNIINYVILELGQPIQIFNLNKIKNINIRFSKKNELFYLNNKKIILDSTTLVVSDIEHIISLSGITHNTNYSIDCKSNNILLESSILDADYIFSKSNKYNINNIYTQRNEKKLDIKFQIRALERITQLILSICDGIPSNIININNKKKIKKLNRSIFLRKKYIYKIIGYKIQINDIENILNSLNFNFLKCKFGWEIKIPSWRNDIKIELDIIEEIIKLYGYNNIPNIFDISNINNIYKSKKHSISINTVKNTLINLGYNEIITYSFISPYMHNLIFKNNKYIKLNNPLSLEHSFMRTSLWVGLLNTAIYNQNRQQKKIKLFEYGICFKPKYNAKCNIKQTNVLSGLITGYESDENWNINNKISNFYNIKGDVESILDLTGELDNFEFLSYNYLPLHPGQAAKILFKNNKIGYIGSLHPKIQDILKFNYPVLLFEIFFNKLKKSNLKYIKNISKLPISRRDISFLVDNNIPVFKIINECKKFIGNKLIDIYIFDVYKDKKIEHKYKSLSISFLVQNTNINLNDEKINNIISKCLELLQTKFKVILRE